MDKKEALIDHQEELTEQIGQIQEESEELLEQSETHTAEMEDIQENSKRLEAELDEMEFQKKKEKQANRLDEVGYILTGMWLTAGVIASGGSALPGLLMGGAVYGIYQTGKQYINHSRNKDLEAYARKHPTASKKEVWEQVMRMRSTK